MPNVNGDSVAQWLAPKVSENSEEELLTPGA